MDSRFSIVHALSQNDYLWVTRVPETIKEARILLERAEAEVSWVDMEKGYKISPFKSSVA